MGGGFGRDPMGTTPSLPVCILDPASPKTDPRGQPRGPLVRAVLILILLAMSPLLIDRAIGLNTIRTQGTIEQIAAKFFG